MKEAMFYKTLDRFRVQCQLCPNNCIILHGKRGSCGVRENHTGRLYSLVYGKLCTASVDPIEKKPLYHFFPGTKTYSVATPGCNLHCKFCQNWQISQRSADVVECFSTTPEEVVKNALRSGCRSISYTYVEPTIFYEFVLDTAKLARKAGLKNILVTNGYINPAPLKKLYQYIDACNIDLKGFSEEFYHDICYAHLKPVLETIKTVHKMGIWLELTTLLIPGLNDDACTVIKELEWIKKELSLDVPVHFSRFFPCYKLAHHIPTPPEILEQAYSIAKGLGFHYVYVGNTDLKVKDVSTDDTYCQKCNRKLISRSHLFTLDSNKIKNGKCPYCKAKISGVFDKEKTRSTRQPKSVKVVRKSKYS
jgi:pyruvate formate lyase activating enzyme